MRAIPAYLTPTTAVIAAATATVLLLTACSGGGSTPPTPTDSDIAATSSAPVSLTAPTVSSTATTSSSPITGPASTTPTTGMTPTLPTDVPTIGPNMRAGEKPPIEPVAALVHTSAGAKAFAVFFIKTIDWGYATTSSTYMRHYYDPSCTKCRSAADGIDFVRNAGHHFAGDRFTGIHLRSAGSGAWLVTFSVGAADVLTRSDKFVGTERAIPHFHELMFVAWSRSWRVTRMEPSE